MQPCVLLAWELGRGFGHVTVLGRIAARLAKHGFRPVAVVENLQPASALAADGVEVLQAPVWPTHFLSDLDRERHSSVTMGDSLGDAGLGDQEALRMLVGAWDRILHYVKPDLVIADYAPGAALAARGRIPLAWVGNGYTLPPADMQCFPPLHNHHPVVWAEDRLTENVNFARRAFNLPALDRLPQLFAGDARWVHTVPLFDPYHAWRKQPADGPMIEGLPQLRRANAAEILVYIAARPGSRTHILSALEQFAGRLRIFAPGLPSGELQRLASFGAQVQTTRFRVNEDLANARLFIHLGSAGMSVDAMLAGVPQLVLSVDIEKDLIGGAMQAAGIGRMIKIHDPAMALTPDIVASLLDDGAMAQQAMDVANAHRVLLRDADPFSEFEAACMNLVK